MYAHMNGNRRMPSTEHAPRDDELMRQVADGSAEALGLLHRRFARVIFGLAVQSLDRAAAEDLVQEVFLAIWRNARRFEPERGTVRAWVLQITHYRLLKLRGTPGPQWAALVAICLLAALGIRYRSEHAMVARYDRALSLVTASDSVNLRLGPVPGTAEATHARYRGRPGAGIAVVTFSQFPPAPAGQIYQTWVRHGATWTSLGTVEPDAGGSARLIAEDPALAVPPDGLEVTLEPRTGSAAPSGSVVVAWVP